MSSFTAPEPPPTRGAVPPGPAQRGFITVELSKKHLWLAVARGRRPRRAQLHKILPEQMRVVRSDGARATPSSWPRPRARARYLKTPRYVPDGLSASDWAARQQKEKAAKVQNKAKYPKGAPQVRSPAFRFVLLL